MKINSYLICVAKRGLSCQVFCQLFSAQRDFFVKYSVKKIINIIKFIYTKLLTFPFYCCIFV